MRYSNENCNCQQQYLILAEPCITKLDAQNIQRLFVGQSNLSTFSNRRDHRGRQGVDPTKTDIELVLTVIEVERGDVVLRGNGLRRRYADPAWATTTWTLTLVVLSIFISNPLGFIVSKEVANVLDYLVMRKENKEVEKMEKRDD